MNNRYIERTTIFKAFVRHFGFYRGDPTSQELEKLAVIRSRMLLVIWIRWMLIMLQCAYGLYAGILVHRSALPGEDFFQPTPLALSLLAAVVCNLLYRLLYRELSHFVLINHLQVFLDTVLLAFTIHFCGGVFSPLWSLYPFLALESVVLLENKRDCWGFWILASCVFGALVCFESPSFTLLEALSSVDWHPILNVLVWSWVVSLGAAITFIGFNVVCACRDWEEKMKLLVIKDQMTNLYNKGYFFKELNSEIQRSIRYRHVFSVVFLDVDDLKKFNDTFGHLEGDRLLRELARVLRQNSRRSETDPPYDIDVPCRFGGDEFAVILPETPVRSSMEGCGVSDGTSAVAFAERIRREIEALSVSASRVSVSIGIASFPHHGKTPDDLVKSADEALYRAKNVGKNRIEIARESQAPPQNGMSSSGLKDGSSCPGVPPNPADSSAAFPAP
jgi:diguanylate cyclase (GGDEF)-like protein